MGNWRKGAVTVVGVACVVAADIGLAMGASIGALGASPPTYSVANVGAYGGEPSIVSDRLGRLYDTTPQGGTLTYTSTNHGASWTQVATASTRSGDDCLATDQANAVYLCNLDGREGKLRLQADVYKSTDQGAHWTPGSGAVPNC